METKLFASIVRPSPRKILLFYALVLHGLMFTYDYASNFRPFLRADRAVTRYVDVMQLVEADGMDEVLAVLSSRSYIGDFVPHALLYMTAGESGIILFQVMLQILSIVAFFEIALLLLGSPTWSLVAALSYASLPHSLIFTHQLSGEALAVPLVVLSFALLLNYRIVGKPAVNLFAAAGLLGLAILVRPVLVLLPFVLSPWLLRRLSFIEAGRTSGFVLLSVVPLLLWMFFIFAQTGTFSLGGNTFADLGSNLYNRVLDQTLRIPKDERTSYTERYLDSAENEKLSVRAYLSFIVERPDLAAKQSLKDLLVLSAKSGVTRVTVDYLDRPQRDREVISQWMPMANKIGFIASTVWLAKFFPIVVLTAGLGVGLFLSFFALAAFGATVAMVRVVRDRADREVNLGLMLLAIHTGYIFATAQSVANIQARLRYPAEFALTVLAVFGLRLAIDWIRRLCETKNNGQSSAEEKIS